MIHTIPMLLLAHSKLPDRKVNTTNGLFTAGILLFSGAFYAMGSIPANKQLHEKITIVAPFGAVAFLAGWLALARYRDAEEAYH